MNEFAQKLINITRYFFLRIQKATIKAIYQGENILQVKIDALTESFVF